MRRLILVLGAVLVLSAGCASTNSDRPDANGGAEGSLKMERTRPARLADPLESVNRAFFAFNDAFYLWVLEPTAGGYAYVFPTAGRMRIQNFFNNLRFPGRFVNCLLQGDPGGMGVTTARFCTNTTIGILGFNDPATRYLDLKPQREDFGQTLAVYGLGPGFYINWPILGPSSVRGTCGYILDWPLYAPNYVPGLTLYERVNYVSLHLGEYEEMKAAALDPYTGLKNAYWQHRLHLIKE